MQINPRAKVVVVSALEQKAILKDAFKAGAADFLVKPFSRQTLVGELENLASSIGPSA